VAVPQLKGMLRIFDLPTLGMADLADMGTDMASARARLDAHRAFQVIGDAARSVGADAFVDGLTAGIDQVAEVLQLETARLFDAATGTLALRVRDRRRSLVPDADVSFRTGDADALQKLVDMFTARAGGALTMAQFEGRTLYSFEPRGRDVPAILSPGFSLDGDVLRASHSSQSLKRALRHSVAAPPPAAPAAGPSGAAAVLMELSPGPSMAVAFDVPRLASIAFDVASMVPEQFGRRFRRVVDRLPPVEDLLSEVCAAAVAVYGTKSSVAIESFSPTGQLPMIAGLAAAAARQEARARRRRGAAPPVEQDEEQWREPVRF
jgi:hypothetical protein